MHKFSTFSTALVAVMSSILKIKLFTQVMLMFHFMMLQLPPFSPASNVNDETKDINQATFWPLAIGVYLWT